MKDDAKEKLLLVERSGVLSVLLQTIHYPSVSLKYRGKKTTLLKNALQLWSSVQHSKVQ